MSKLDDLKLSGEAPQFLTEEGYITLSNGYLLKDETPKGMYHRVAKSAASYYKDSSKWYNKFFDAMWKNWLCAATPILSNNGTNRGLNISCNSVSIADSVDSIFMKNYEFAILSKNGAGVGIYLGDIRGTGAPISGNGVSDGILSWAHCLDATTSAISQGSTRRSASAVYLPIEHPDAEDFISIRRPIGDVNRQCLNINHGVCISDSWLNQMLNGDKEKRRIYTKLLTTRFETGEPYIFFTDNVNNASPECYKANNLDVKCSNICCFSGDTYILTKKGAKKIKDLVGQEAEIFDGKQWVKNNAFKKKGEAELVRIHLKDKDQIDCTDNHRWFVSPIDEDYKETLTKDLKIGDYIECKPLSRNKKLEGHQIVGIEKLEGIHDVYCTTVPSTGKFALMNGLMTGNSEIMLHVDPDHTFVCCLSSLNLVRWEEWKDTDLVNTAVRFLDAILSEYIEKTENMKGMEAARRSAIKGRAIGVGVLGWHTLLQERGLAFDSFGAMQLNGQIFKSIHTKCEEETKIMAEELGEPEWCKGFNRRHTHTIACAPTVSNSIISGGYSPGIEPISANIFAQKSAKGTFIVKNKTLEKLLESKGLNTPETWSSINEYSGSVQHLDCLTSEEKEVFLTAREINQHAIIKQAAHRQQWIDQGQSVNLFFAQNSTPQYIHDVHIAAWKGGLKTLYYLRSDGVIKGDLASRTETDCKACEG